MGNIIHLNEKEVKRELGELQGNRLRNVTIPISRMSCRQYRAEFSF
jgi:hypothetical protein